MRKVGIRKHPGVVIGQRRRQCPRVVIDDQDLAHDVCRFASSGGQLSKEEFVGGIPRTERLVRTGWIAREFEFALGHPQPFIPSRKHASAARSGRLHNTYKLNDISGEPDLVPPVRLV